MGERLAEDLLWTQEERERNFARMEALFPVNRVRHGVHVRPLRRGEPLRQDGQDWLARYLADEHAAGLLVLQDGAVREERYALTLTPEGRWTSFSVTKSVSSTLVGAAVRDGAIRGVDDPVIRYIPELRRSAYDGVSVRELLLMTSGVRWVEDYFAPDSDNVQLYGMRHRPGTDTVVEYMRRKPREADPGTRWVYKTGETDLTGVLVRRATGKTLSAYLSEKIWEPCGMERDAVWIAEDGREFGGSGLAASLRDFGRFGQFVLEGGHEAVRPDWFVEATERRQVAGMPDEGYGYQWWRLGGSSFAALGIFGQSILIDPEQRLVVVLLSAWPEATSRERSDRRVAFWDRVRASL